MATHGEKRWPPVGRFSGRLRGGFHGRRHFGRAWEPDRVVGPDNATIFTEEDIQNGQDLFRKRGLMDYGTVLGHGAYLGPDYTAEALHWMTEAMRPANYESLGVGAK